VKCSGFISRCLPLHTMPGERARLLVIVSSEEGTGLTLFRHRDSVSVFSFLISLRTVPYCTLQPCRYVSRMCYACGYCTLRHSEGMRLQPCKLPSHIKVVHTILIKLPSVLHRDPHTLISTSSQQHISNEILYFHPIDNASSTCFGCYTST